MSALQLCLLLWSNVPGRGASVCCVTVAPVSVYREQAWPSHSQCCDEREFRIQLNYDKIVARHARLACVASSTEEGGRGRGSVSGCLSMNPMHKIREAGSIANTYSPGSIALINNTARVNMNTGLSSIDSHGAAPLEIEMTYRDSWYDNVKRAGERKTKAVDVIKEEDCEEVETQGYSADYDSGPDMEVLYECL